MAASLATAAVAALGFVTVTVTNAQANRGTPQHQTRQAAAATNATLASSDETAIAAQKQCSDLPNANLLSVKGAPARIYSASVVTWNGAKYCIAHGYTNPQEQFSVELPLSTWHGDYLQIGCGGLCGGLFYEQTPPAASGGCAQVTNNEFVYALDDQGHEDPQTTPGPLDAIWAADNLPARVTFGYTSEHRLRLVAGAVIKAFYGRQPRTTYFDGCSGGGHEALDLAQRYPTDFNGILAGAPANNWAALMAESLAWDALSNTDRHGNVILTSDKLPALHGAVMKRCANAAGYISDPRDCTFDPSSIQCPARTDTVNCLTSRQVTVTRALYRGPHDSHNHEFFAGGLPYGSELAWDGWSTNKGGPSSTLYTYLFAQNYLRYMAFEDSKPNFKLTSWKFDTGHYTKLEKFAGVYDATSPDLAAFKKAGGKLLMWAGWADQAIPPFNAVDYYAAVENQMGGFATSQQFSRLYMVPGGYHCLVGGDPASTAQFLTPLINWVQQGDAPSAITLPVSTQTASNKVASLTVRPFNAAAPAPKNHGLNSNFRPYQRSKLYSRTHLLTCPVKNGNYVCKHLSK